MFSISDSIIRQALTTNPGQRAGLRRLGALSVTGDPRSVQPKRKRPLGGALITPSLQPYPLSATAVLAFQGMAIRSIRSSTAKNTTPMSEITTTEANWRAMSKFAPAIRIR